jgi:hypothetical protein
MASFWSHTGSIYSASKCRHGLLVGAGAGLRRPASGSVGAVGAAEPLAAPVGAAVALPLAVLVGAPVSLGLADGGAVGSMAAEVSGAEPLDVVSAAGCSVGLA